MNHLLQPTSFLWYDLETWGIDPRRSRIAQFAAQRTDAQLNPVGEPEVVWFAPALDFVPAPEAVLVTGLDPHEVERRGHCEAEAMQQVAALMSEPGTCSVGWNTLRFDDEFIRYTLFRNFHDPYAREWAQGNSRWDLLDFARLCHALRPEGIEWPKHEDGTPSFRLEHLAAANGVSHHSAHDALSDVEATLGMARLFRSAQPRLWDYHLSFRSKQRVGELLNLAQPRPLLHVSSKFPASRGCAGIVLPICRHPRAGNQVVTLELHDEPDWLQDDPEQIAARVFVANDQLPPGQTRIALKAVHLNRCPALTELRHVRDAELQRLGLDRDRCLRHAELIARSTALADRVAAAFALSRFEAASQDVDHSLYDALPERADEAVRARIRSTAPDRLNSLNPRFRDTRGNTLWWRYRARNWPSLLSADERAAWEQERLQRVRGQADPAALSLPVARDRIQELRNEHASNPPLLSLLDRLDGWYERLEASSIGPAQD